MRVALAEDSLLVREGLVTLLERAEGLEVCGVASDRAELEQVVAAARAVWGEEA